MDRRTFLQSGLVALAARRLHGAGQRPIVMTVAGPISPTEMGLTLPHEHVMVDFIGAEKATRDRYDGNEVFRVALPHLKRVKELGCRTLVECTPAYLARDPALLKRLSDAAGLHILTNTGYYNALNGKYLPAHAREESADRLADRWTGEWERGIGDTGIKPGLIKIGVNAPLDAIDRKLITAAARCHKRTGLTIAAHSGPATAALREIDILEEERVHPSAWVWVHAQAEADTKKHVEAGRRGAWVEFDGIASATLDLHLRLVQNMKEHGLLHRVLVSQDAGWYNVGQPGGGNFRPYDTVMTEFLPALRRERFTDDEVKLLTITNPAEAFTVRVRQAQ